MPKATQNDGGRDRGQNAAVPGAVGLGRSLGWLPPALARLGIGIALIQGGLTKLSSIWQVADLLEQLNVPAPRLAAHLLGGTELVCGVLLVLGLLARLSALVMALGMLVVIGVAKLDGLSTMADLFGLHEFTRLVVFTWIGVAGAGSLSLDTWLEHKLRQRSARLLLIGRRRGWLGWPRPQLGGRESAR